MKACVGFLSNAPFSSNKVLLITKNNFLHRFPLRSMTILSLAYFKGILAAVGISLVGLCHLTTSQDGFDVSDEDGEAGLLTDEYIICFLSPLL